MDTAFINLLKKHINRDKLKLDRKVVVFLFFVLIASILWFLNSISKEYITEISYPVRYNLPEGKELLDELPTDFTVKVRAYGFTILGYKFSSQVNMLNIDVNALSLKRVPGGKDYEFYILTDFAKERIEEQIEQKIAIVDIKPDSLIFRFSSLVERKLPVIQNIDVEFEKQFMLDGKIEVEPDSIVVSGPKPIIDTMLFVRTEYFDFRIIDKTTERNIMVQNYDKIRYSQKSVRVKVPVEKYTEASMQIPISVINLPDSLTLKTIPSDVILSYFVGLSDFDNVKVDDFKVVVDYLSIEENISPRLSVIIESPDIVRSVKPNIKSVEYYIGKK